MEMKEQITEMWDEIEGVVLLNQSMRIQNYKEVKEMMIKRFSRDITPLLEEALKILSDLWDDDPCEFDHHGNCQAHDWFGVNKCPQARILELMDRNTKPHA